jgi:UV excision repair protein RAD23
MQVLRLVFFFTVLAATPAAAAASAPTGAAGPSDILTGGALESAIAGICEMGFEREQVC